LWTVGAVLALESSTSSDHITKLDEFERHQRIIEKSTSNKDYVELYWSADVDSNRIKLALVTTATGWVALGLGQKSSMKGLDLVVFNEDEKSPEWSATDYFSTDYQKPQPDPEHLQDWALHQATENGTHTILHFSRDLVTRDDDDFPITGRPLWVASSFGHTHIFGYHARAAAKQLSFLYNINQSPPQLPVADMYTNHTIRERLYNGSRILPPVEPDAFSADFSVEHLQYVIPSEPVNQYTCFKIDTTRTIGDVRLHYTATAPLVHDELVHHSITATCSSDAYDGMPDVIENCIMLPLGCTYMFGTAPGMEYVGFPPDVSGERSTRLLVMTHFTNPRRLQNITATHGFHMYFQRRANAAEFGLYGLLLPDTQIRVP
jgi:hypothetical protein